MRNERKNIYRMRRRRVDNKNADEGEEEEDDTDNDVEELLGNWYSCSCSSSTCSNHPLLFLLQMLSLIITRLLLIVSPLWKEAGGS